MLSSALSVVAERAVPNVVKYRHSFNELPFFSVRDRRGPFVATAKIRFRSSNNRLARSRPGQRLGSLMSPSCRQEFVWGLLVDAVSLQVRGFRMSEAWKIMSPRSCSYASKHIPQAEAGQPIPILSFSLDYSFFSSLEQLPLFFIHLCSCVSFAVVLASSRPLKNVPPIISLPVNSI